MALYFVMNCKHFPACKEELKRNVLESREVKIGLRREEDRESRRVSIEKPIKIVSLVNLSPSD